MLTKASILAALGSTAAAETIFNALIFTRHGDRTAKFWNNAVLTNLGAEETFSSGQFYRDRYLANGSDFQIAGVSSDIIVPTQLMAAAPMSLVLYQSATDFLQGFYPPLVSLDDSLAGQELANGTESIAPLGGYQYVLVNGADSNSPNAIWLTGNTGCPAFTQESDTYYESSEYLELLNSTADFYQQFDSLLGPIMGTQNLTYKNAYLIFDLLNVASIHNASVAPQINEEALLQAQYLADAHEFNLVYNATQNMRSIAGQTLGAQILAQINATVQSKAENQKVTLLAGSYDIFQSFFGLTNLTEASPDFYGLPAYAATMVFELFSNDDNAAFPENPMDDLNIRFLFRNGTDESDELTQFPLFGLANGTMTYGDFVNTMSARSVSTLGQWCNMCNSTQSFCASVTTSAAATEASEQAVESSVEADFESDHHCSSLSNVSAGGIGAGVTIFVVGLVAGLGGMWFMTRRKNTAYRNVPATAATGGNGRTRGEEGLEVKRSNASVSSASGSA